MGMRWSILGVGAAGWRRMDRKRGWITPIVQRTENRETKPSPTGEVRKAHKLKSRNIEQSSPGRTDAKRSYETPVTSVHVIFGKS